MMEQAQKLVDMLTVKNYKVVTAESVTGGLVAGAITSIEGSSSVFEMGYVVYSNAKKQEILGILPNDLNTYSEYSPQIAIEMAKSALTRSGADIAVSTTGVAGPGPNGKCCQGKVFIGVATKSSADSTEYTFEGDRGDIRGKTVAAALNFAYQKLSADRA